MRNRRPYAIAVFLIALFLYALQAGIWARSTAHARSETAKQNIEEHHQPTLFPAIAATIFLIAAGAIASVPQRSVTAKSHT
ncbi:MAG: hypothetical protein WBR26_17420 [Candidatus Acidiferrum sp.]